MKLDIKGPISISIPSEYQKLETMPEDPANSVAFGKVTNSATCFALAYPINHASAMVN